MFMRWMEKQPGFINLERVTVDNGRLCYSGKNAGKVKEFFDRILIAAKNEFTSTSYHKMFRVGSKNDEMKCVENGVGQVNNRGGQPRSQKSLTQSCLILI